MSSDVLLRCEGVSKRFGGLAALRDVSFDVAQGAIIGLIGPNGAGKTTLFNCLSGFQRPDAGTIEVAGQAITAHPDRAARLGVVRTFQSVRMFPGLTVLESLLVAQYRHGRATAVEAVLRLPRHRREMREMRDRAAASLELLGIEGLAHRLSEDQPLLAQRKIEVARAVLAEPRVLLLDEPSAGATPKESEELAEVFRKVNESGTTVLVIEHNVPFITGLAHRVEVLHLGELVASCAPDEVADHAVVSEIYLGKSA